MKTKFMLFIELIFVSYFLLGCITIVNNYYYFESFDEAVSAMEDFTEGPSSCGGMTLTHLDVDQFEEGFIRDSFHQLGGIGSLQARNAGEISLVHIGGIDSLYEIDDEALAYVMVAIDCGVPQVYYNEDENSVHGADELAFHYSIIDLSLSSFGLFYPELGVDEPTYEILSKLAESDTIDNEMNSYRYGQLNDQDLDLLRVTFFYSESFYQEALNETEERILAALIENLDPLGYPTMTFLSPPTNLSYSDGVLSWIDDVNTGDFIYEFKLKISTTTHIFCTNEKSADIKDYLIAGDYLFTFSVQAISDDTFTLPSPKVTFSLVQNESGVPILTAPIPQNLTMDSPYPRLEWDEVLGVTMYQVKAVIHHRLGGTTTQVYPVLTNHMNLFPSDFAIYLFDEIEFFVRAMGTEDSPEGLLANPFSGNPYTYNSPFSDSVSLFSLMD